MDKIHMNNQTVEEIVKSLEKILYDDSNYFVAF